MSKPGFYSICLLKRNFFSNTMLARHFLAWTNCTRNTLGQYSLSGLRRPATMVLRDPLLGSMLSRNKHKNDQRNQEQNRCPPLSKTPDFLLLPIVGRDTFCVVIFFFFLFLHICSRQLFYEPPRFLYFYIVLAPCFWTISRLASLPIPLFFPFRSRSFCTSLAQPAKLLSRSRSLSILHSFLCCNQRTPDNRYSEGFSLFRPSYDHGGKEFLNNILFGRMYCS